MLIQKPLSGYEYNDRIKFKELRGIKYATMCNDPCLKTGYIKIAPGHKKDTQKSGMALVSETREK